MSFRAMIGAVVVRSNKFGAVPVDVFPRSAAGPRGSRGCLHDCCFANISNVDLLMCRKRKLLVGAEQISYVLGMLSEGSKELLREGGWEIRNGG